AIHFGKPLLVMPEHTVEQRVNALAVERMRIGMRVAHADVRPAVFRELLAREAEFRGNMEGRAKDARIEAVGAIETFAKELVTGPRVVGALTGKWSTV